MTKEQAAALLDSLATLHALLEPSAIKALGMGATELRASLPAETPNKRKYSQCRICGRGARTKAQHDYIAACCVHTDALHRPNQPNKGTAYCDQCEDETLVIQGPAETPAHEERQTDGLDTRLAAGSVVSGGAVVGGQQSPAPLTAPASIEALMKELGVAHSQMCGVWPAISEKFGHDDIVGRALRSAQIILRALQSQAEQREAEIEERAFWVIEKYEGPGLVYWSGRRGELFTYDISWAVRFQRLEDAELVRVHVVEQGQRCRSAQHLMLAAYRQQQKEK